MHNQNSQVFGFALANKLKVSQAKLSLFSITESVATNMMSIPINKESLFGETQQNFKISISPSDAQFFCICAQLIEVELENTLITLDDRVVELISIFNASDKLIILNEPSTIASAFTFNRFCLIEAISKSPTMLYHLSESVASVCYAMKNNLCDSNGRISDVLSQSPNAMETNSYALFNFLSNLVYYNIVDTEFYQSFLNIEATQAKSFFSSLQYLIQHPFDQVQAIYDLVSQQVPLYSPSLAEIKPPEGQSCIPNQLTLTIKVNHTGSKNFLFGGPAYVVFDKNDRAWIVNNVRQGTPNSATFCVILEPDGSPASFSPLFGGGILGGGFGITVNNQRDKIFIGNYGWGPTQCNPQIGGVAGFTCDGQALTPADGFTKYLCRVQGLNFDRHDNLWMSSWGSQAPLAPSGGNYYPYKSQNSAIVVYLDSDPKNALCYEFDGPGHCTFDVFIDNNDIAYVSNAGSSDAGKQGNSVPSSLHTFRIQDNQLIRIASFYTKDYEGFRQVTTDANGNIYVGAIKSNLIYKFSAADKQLKNPTRLSCSAVNRAWGLTFDGDNTLFVANFGKSIANDKHHDGGLGVSILPGGDESQAKCMTLPSGGEEVYLANGFPLYGEQVVKDNDDRILQTDIWPKCFQPLMRLTSTNIDRAGNLWAINNWKPSGVLDLTENPGGDGVVIFIGVATPKHSL